MSNIPSTPADGAVRTSLVTSIADIALPKTTTEVNAVSSKEISCYITAGGFSFPLSQAAIADERECDTFAGEAPGRKSISGPTISVIDNTGTPLSATANVAVDTLVEGTTLYIVRRYGKAFSAAFAAADKVDIFKVIVGAKRRIQPEANSVLRSEYTFFVQDYKTDVALVA